MAVFLALATGIVLGTTALNGAVLSDLRGRVDGLTDDRAQLLSQVRQLQGQVAVVDGFAAGAAPVLLAHQLTGRTVLMLSAPDAGDALRRTMVGGLQLAGAPGPFDVRLGDGFTTPASNDRFAAAVEQLVVPALAVPAGATLDDVVAAEVAAAVTGRAESGTRLDAPAVAALRAGLVTLGVLRSVPPATGVPDLALLLVGSGSSSSKQAPDPARDRVLALATKLADLVPEVVAGPLDAATGNGALAALRSNGGGAVSTVDRADSAFGQVLTVLALVEAEKGTSGQYGVGPGATDGVPTPTPTPTPTATPTSTSTPTSRGRVDSAAPTRSAVAGPGVEPARR